MLINLDDQIAKCTNLYLNLWCKCRLKIGRCHEKEKKKSKFRATLRELKMKTKYM